ncbi:hypothetical protein LCGC14_2995570 [marine sediment metagenome]|uniref:Uncharacterized protein n=1 Tax=marine sediment metagenome TaxID=412755 RepID=A0A0F8ZA23_9ZZZZ
MLQQCFLMAEKITRTWKIDDDIANELDAFCARTHLGRGEAIQLGAWIVIHTSPEEKQALLEMMDARRDIPISIGTMIDRQRADQKAVERLKRQQDEQAKRTRRKKGNG